MEEFPRNIVDINLIAMQFLGSSFKEKEDINTFKTNVIVVLTDDQGYGDLA